MNRRVDYILKVTATLFLVAAVSVFASASEYKQVKFDVSLVPGLSIGSAIADGQKVERWYGINLIAGHEARLRKGEFGTILNWVDENANGWQIAGGVNLVGRDQNGFSLGGIGNFSRGMNGAQLGGMNFIRGEVNGIQLGALGNFVAEETNGIQLAGGANFVNNDFNGIQYSSILNVTNGSVSGIQFAGVGSVTRRSLHGIGINAAGHIVGGGVEGVVWATGGNLIRRNVDGIVATIGGNVIGGDVDGIVGSIGGNLVRGSVDGIAYANGFNIVGREVNGVQASGFFNYAQDVDGVQIGLINYNHSSKGALVGPLSYSKKFGAQIEAFGDENGVVGASYTSGNRDWYNRFFAGARQFADPKLAVIGFSTGTIEKHHNGTRWMGIGYKMLNYDANLGYATKPVLAEVWFLEYLMQYKIVKGVSVFGGPTLNYYRSDVSGTPINGYELLEKDDNGRHYRRWTVGFTGGVRLF